MKEPKIYYTVRAVQRETNASHRPQKGDYIWLDWTDEGGGWVQWSSDKSVSHHYTSPQQALKEARASDGMPWWCKPDMKSLTLFKITYHPAWREISECGDALPEGPK